DATITTASTREGTSTPEGIGLPNPKSLGTNACYVNATLQALRHVPAFRQALEQVTTVLEISIPLLLDIKKQLCNPATLVGTLVSKGGHTNEIKANLRNLFLFEVMTLLKKIDEKQKVELIEVNSIRNLAIALGFAARGKTTQEDASELYTFILDLMNTPLITVTKEIKHGFTGIVRSLTPPPDTESFLSLNLGATPDQTALQNLISQLKYFEEIDLMRVTLNDGQQV